MRANRIVSSSGMLFFAIASLLLCSLVGAQLQATQTYLPPPAASGNLSSSVSASSGAPSSQRWNELLGNTLFFYDIQRAGTLPSDFRVSWRNNSVPNDGSDVGLNLSGGHFDAGNYIKATLPLCWVVTQLSWSAMMFGTAYETAGQTAYLDQTLRVMLDWLLTASSKQDELVVLIGSDDFYWGGDQNIPLNNRPSFVISRQAPGTDVFGSCATAMASASMMYAGTSLPLSTSRNGSAIATDMQDSNYAQTLLQRSQSLFDLAQTSTPQQLYQKAVKGVAWAYPSTDYADELVLSSTMLALATGNQSYADYAQQTYAASQFPFPNGCLNWDQHTPATPVLLAQLGIARPSMNVNVQKYQADAESWFDAIINRTMPQTFTTPGGLFWFEGDSDADSLNPALNAAWLMRTYRGMASSTAKAEQYDGFAQSQVDYALGNNPMNAVYVVGQHPNSAQNPQSALASGGTNPQEIDTDPVQEAYVLYGGLVGGPDKHDNYYDERGNWQQTEVALDSQSAMMGLAASHIVSRNASVDPFYVGMTQDRVILPYSSGGGGGGGLSSGAQAAIAVVVIVVVLVLVGGLAYWKRESIRTWNRQRRFARSKV